MRKKITIYRSNIKEHPSEGALEPGLALLVANVTETEWYSGFRDGSRTSRSNYLFYFLSKLTPI